MGTRLPHTWAVRMRENAARRFVNTGLSSRSAPGAVTRVVAGVRAPTWLCFGLSWRQDGRSGRCQSPGRACGGAGAAVCSCVCVFKVKAGVTGSVSPHGQSYRDNPNGSSSPGISSTAWAQLSRREGRLARKEAHGIPAALLPGEWGPAAPSPPDGFFAEFLPNVQHRGFLTVGWSVGLTRSSEASIFCKNCCLKC